MTQSNSVFAAGINLIELREKIIQCVAQPVKELQNGRRQAFPMVSRCSDLTLRSPQEAVLNFKGEVFTLVLNDSEESDGGDLNDLMILNSKSQVIFEIKGVLGFRDVLYAIVGRDVRIPRVSIRP